jgi:hypothetical protein
MRLCLWWFLETVVRDMELEVVDGGWDRCVCMVSVLLAKGKRYSR